MTELALVALRQARRHGRLVVCLYALDLAFTLALAWIIGHDLAGLTLPPPEPAAHPAAFGWALLLEQQRPALVALAQRAGALYLLYGGLVAPLAAAAGLACLARASSPEGFGTPRDGASPAGVSRALRRWGPRLVALRVLVATLQLGLLAAWALSAYQLHEMAWFQRDERRLLVGEGALALLVAILLLVIAAQRHYAQVFVVDRGLSVLPALRRALATIHAHPLPTLGLWAIYLGLWLALTLPVLAHQATLPGLSLTLGLGQIAALLKVAALVWSWAAALALQRRISSKRTSLPN